jgi:outer membrane protein
MIKKITLIAAIICSLAMVSNAQSKIAIVDTKYILDKIPDYKAAQTKLNQFSEQWQREIDVKNTEVEKMFRDFEAEQVMLSDELKKKREDQLFNKEKELRDLQKQRFGYEGDLFKKRQELVKPIQDKVYTAIQKIAQQRGYDLILDKSEGITVIFADPKLDRSEDVLKELGVK